MSTNKRFKQNCNVINLSDVQHVHILDVSERVIAGKIPVRPCGVAGNIMFLQPTTPCERFVIETSTILLDPFLPILEPCVNMVECLSCFPVSNHTGPTIDLGGMVDINRILRQHIEVLCPEY